MERTRQPRPAIPPPPLRDDPIWSTVQGPAKSSRPGNAEVETASRDGGDLFGTAAIVGAEGVPSVVGGPFNDWRLVATVERRVMSKRDWREKEEDIAERYRNIEIRQSGDEQALDLPPIAVCNFLTWNFAPAPNLAAKEWIRSRPVVGLDRRMLSAADGYHGLGFQKLLLTPTPWLSNALELKRGSYFILEDGHGPAVALITWRSEYETSDYYLAWPRLHGAGLVVRSDAFDNLVHVAQGKLIYRDFLVRVVSQDVV